MAKDAEQDRMDRLKRGQSWEGRGGLTLIIPIQEVGFESMERRNREKSGKPKKERISWPLLCALTLIISI